MCFRLKLSHLCVLTSLIHFLLAIKGEREEKMKEIRAARSDWSERDMTQHKMSPISFPPAPYFTSCCGSVVPSVFGSRKWPLAEHLETT